jgi:putative acetyltransferase
VLVGDPAFYRRFGFASDGALAVAGVPPDVTLSLRFSPSGDHGTVDFHAAFAAAMAGA